MTSGQTFPVWGPSAARVRCGGARAGVTPLRSGIRYGGRLAGSVFGVDDDVRRRQPEAAPEGALQVATEYEVTMYRGIGGPDAPGGPFPRSSASFTP